MANQPITLELDAKQTERAFSLSCQIIHQAGLAREAFDRQDYTACVAHYYRMDTELMSRLMGVLPKELQDRLNVMAATASEGPGK